ncbi:MAG: methyltransferase domain-containing protein [Desulfohalobiaceae bacterium]
MHCRHCQTPLQHVFLDLGFAPPSNAYLRQEDLLAPETHFPLKLYVCHSCWLVQTEDYADPEQLFQADYAYFSSTSRSWLEHARKYYSMITEYMALDEQSLVVEVGSNDGYLLQNFLSAGIPCLGVEPASGVAAEAERLGIPVLQEFFGSELGMRLASENRQADLIVGNNVYAHVPDINDFTSGLRAALKPGGTVSLEFPHLLNLIRFCQFDTVYHEHYSYLCLHTVQRIFSAHGLKVFDVQELSTHGGSLRVYGCRLQDQRAENPSIRRLLEKERQYGLQDIHVYQGFQVCAERIKDDLLLFLLEQKRQGKTVAAYGAAAKGNTLLNYAGVKPDLLPFVCDGAFSKQGKYLPGSHIPIRSQQALQQVRPEFILILPWNLRSEIADQLQFIRHWGGKFVVAVPELEVF